MVLMVFAQVKSVFFATLRKRFFLFVFEVTAQKSQVENSGMQQ